MGKIYRSRAPVRISLCNGGDTNYYIKEMGWTNLINATLESLMYFCEVEEKKQDFIDYSYKNTFLKKGNYRRIMSLDSKEDDLRLIIETIKEVNPYFRGNIRISTNVPEKSGLGGSSSLVVSLIKSLIKTKKTGNINSEKIAWLAYKIEREIVGIKGGYQDQWAAAFSGGVNYLEFRKNNVFLEPLWLSEKLMRKLERNLVLFYLEPRKGDSGEIHKFLAERLKKNKREDIKIMLQRRDNVVKTREALLQEDFLKFAHLLNEEQKSKERLMKNVSTKKFSRLYEEALKNRALAGKISGAGSGGCAFFLYVKKDRKKFIKKMEELGCKNLPVKIQRLNTMGEI